ncbi:MAG: helix-hairpin-helix domain-containing protein [Actinobacteria bacterium]|nr:helix-hairpin-helix domain-containing protein [Actinomycetota bacterium]
MFELNINPEQKRGLTIIFALTIGLGGFYFLNSRPQAEPVVIQEIAPAITESATARLIINVAGKVKNPGVYQLPQGSRVVDAIEAAGKQLKGVDISDINLARILVDGEQILVGGSRVASGKAAPKKITADNPLDINRASIAQLDTLPGIGPVTAQRIIDYRTKVGRINTVDELKKISGLGGAKFEEIKNLLRVL